MTSSWSEVIWTAPRPYMGSSPIRNCFLLGPYSRTMPRALRWSWRGAVSHERGSHVPPSVLALGRHGRPNSVGSEGRRRRWGTPTMPLHTRMQHRERTDNASQMRQAYPKAAGGRFSAPSLSSSKRQCKRCTRALGPLKSNRQSQFHEFTVGLTSNVNPHYLSRSQ